MARMGAEELNRAWYITPFLRVGQRKDLSMRKNKAVFFLAFGRKPCGKQGSGFKQTQIS